MDCDGDGLEDHVCVGDTFLAAITDHASCGEAVGETWDFYSGDFCDAALDSVKGHRKSTSVPMAEPCPTATVTVGSCSVCSQLAGTPADCSTGGPVVKNPGP